MCLFQGIQARRSGFIKMSKLLPKMKWTRNWERMFYNWMLRGKQKDYVSRDSALWGTGRSLIYSSNKDEDNFVIYFLVNASQVQQQDAGIYSGKISYVVETDQGKQEFPIDIQCDIPPVFSVNVTAPPGGVSFTHVLANTPPQDKEVLVTVFSNLHKPYQVLQDLQTNMTNQQGKEFDNKYFTIQVEIPSGQKGQTDFTEFSPMQTGEYPIFSSDAYGQRGHF